MKLTRVTLATASSVLVLATLAACGGDSGDGTATEGAGPVTTQGNGPGGGSGTGFQMPGASGEVAAVSGKTAQVQNDQTGQVAVSWNADTSFTQEVDGSLSDIEVGTCVVVTTDDAGSGDDGSGDATEPPTEVTAASVRILPAAGDDGCSMRPDGGSSGMPTDRPSDLPSDQPSDVPSNMPSGGPGGGPGRTGGLGTVGEVSAVSGSGFTVSSDGDDAADVTVTVTGDTTYTKTAKATAAAVTTGVCVTARGDSDDTGAVTATSISVSEPVDGECTGGFAFGGRGGAPGGTA